MADEQIKQTCLYSLHVELGAKMVPFAGYDMPVQYPAGIMAEHLHARDEAGLFDVSHMGQAYLEAEAGGDVAALFERLVPGDIKGLKPGQIRYTLLLNDEGGIRDDLMVTRPLSEAGEVIRRLYLVVNAACKDADFAFIAAALKGVATLKRLEDRALLALQGPKASEVLGRLNPAVRDLSFMYAGTYDLGGAECFISRSGYTGEDGYEISVPEAQAEALARHLLGEPEVMPIGLGARDSLRLEAGLCLYGHDIDEITTPVEANLVWAIGKRRKMDKDFPAAEKIMEQVFSGVARKRVGILPDGRAPAREGTEVVDAAGQVIGKITSGGFGPTLGGPLAMGYVESRFAADGTAVGLMVRGKVMPAHVAPMPFVPHRYFKKSSI
jgi:aminomethyltransferase